MAAARVEIHHGIAVIPLDNPPVNGLSHTLRDTTMTALRQAQADPAVAAIVLIGAAQDFSAGADIREFGTAAAGQAPRLPALITATEDSPKPVIAAIAGSCLGGGLELALGAHLRVALADARLGLPEIHLGLIPGAGGTQRLPRLLGMARALKIMLTGQPQRASTLADTPLLDAVVTDDLQGAALTLAREAAAGQRAWRRTRDVPLDVGEAQTALAAARDRLPPAGAGQPAPAACLEAAAAGLTQSFDTALQTERNAFVRLMDTPASRALRHAFAAERAAGKIAGLAPGTQARPVTRVGVIGAGTMGGGIAMSLRDAGIPVVLLETTAQALERGLATIRRNYAAKLDKGTLTPAAFEERLAGITGTLDDAALGDVDLVIEAVFEDMGVKEQVFRRLDAIARPGAILASNTSALDIDRIAAFTARPQDVIGLHFFSPANVMRLLEVVRGARTADDVLLTAMTLARRMGKVAVVSGVCEGFIGNRMVGRYGAAAADLINQGALPQQVDGALQDFGLKMGPYRMGDLAGLDIGWAGRKRRAQANPAAYRRVVADVLCEAGRFGQKTGAGWYRYAPGSREPLPDPEVETMIAAFRSEHGIAPRRVEDAEIVERCVYALVNEGARILEEGIAARASDIDVVYLNGYGFPRHRGGPMQYANEVGLPTVVKALQRFADTPGADRAAWTPAPLLVRLAEEGRTFA